MFRNFGIGVFVIFALIIAIVGYNAAAHWVYWSPNEEVGFESGGVRLAGTIVKPADEGTFPGVVLLHGSGPQTRAEPTTPAVVNSLVRHGFAVLTYDKRGAGASGGNFETALYRDFIADAIAAIEYMASRDDVDAERMGLYVVSESGWFAPEIASRTGRIDFIFNKVGPPLSWVDTVRWETRNDYLAEGISEVDVDVLVDFAVRRWRYYQMAALNPDLREGAELDAINAEIVRLGREIAMADQVLPTAPLDYNVEAYAKFAANSSYDGTAYLQSLEIPLYYAFGGVDINVPTQASIEVLDKLIDEAGKDITYKVYENRGHSLMSWRGLFNMGFPPGYFATLGEWSQAKVSASDASPE
jgi:pimeloyl-ACP methyl ester carboxylesterase